MDKAETCYVRGKFQCDKGKDRSTNDYFRVVKHYHPTATLEDMIAPINDQYNNSGKKSIYYGLCPDIRKDNFRADHFSYGTSFFGHDFGGQGFDNCNVKFKEFKNE